MFSWPGLEYPAADLTSHLEEQTADLRPHPCCPGVHQILGPKLRGPLTRLSLTLHIEAFGNPSGSTSRTDSEHERFSALAPPPRSPLSLSPGQRPPLRTCIPPKPLASSPPLLLPLGLGDTCEMCSSHFVSSILLLGNYPMDMLVKIENDVFTGFPTWSSL